MRCQRRFTWVLMVADLLLFAGPGETATSGEILNTGREFSRQGRLDEAVSTYHQVVEAAGADGTNDAAIALNNICMIEQARGRLAEAEETCRSSLGLRRVVGDLRGTGRTLNNLGLVLLSLGKFDAAAESFEEALAINQQREDAEAELVNLVNLAQLAIRRGEHGLALRRLTAAERRLRELHGEPWVREHLAWTRLNRGVVLEALGLYREALATYNDLDAEALDPLSRTALELNRGVVYRNLGDPQLALQAFSAAGERAREISYGEAEVFAALDSAIVLRRNLGDPQAAEPFYRRALERSLEIGDRSTSLTIALELAELSLARGELAGAAAEFLRIEREATSEGFGAGIWRSVRGSGEVALATGDRLAARLAFERALEHLDRLRGEVESSSVGDRYAVELRPTYTLAVDNLVHLAAASEDTGYLHEALAVAQQAKRSYAGRSADGHDLDLRRVRQALQGAALLEFYVGSENLYSWLVTDDEVSFHNLGAFAPSSSEILELHSELAGGNSPTTGRLEELSQTLLQGLEPDSVRGKRLFIATDGRLGYLPFELLPVAGGALIDLATVLYLPSGSELASEPSVMAPVAGDAGLAAYRLVGFADPAQGESDELVAQVARRFGLGPLPGAAREVQAAADAAGPGASLTLHGAEASESALVALSPLRAGVLHFGAHSVLEEEVGLGSAILLASSESDDGLLFPSEIRELDLDISLTVLAGCRTALGEDDRANALSELAGAFLEAGSGGVMATLWDVSDQATEVFMGEFYRQLSAGRLADDALRRAKQRLRRDPAWAAPHLWSPYVLIGSAARAPLPRSGPRELLLWGALGLTILAGGLLIHRLRARS